MKVGYNRFLIWQAWSLLHFLYLCESFDKNYLLSHKLQQRFYLCFRFEIDIIIINIQILWKNISNRWNVKVLKVIEIFGPIIKKKSIELSKNLQTKHKKYPNSNNSALKCSQHEQRRCTLQFPDSWPLIFHLMKAVWKASFFITHNTHRFHNPKTR